MQIMSVELANIKSHRQLKLDFSAGINVLAGANGVGKSTVFEAIGYAMFGVDAKNFVGNVDRFVAIGAKRGQIAVVFATTEGCFRVSRTVGTQSRWLLAQEIGGEFEVEEHKDSKETEERLKELLGLKGGRSLAEQFELVIGPFQHEFLGPFVVKQPAKRRDKFDEILGIDSWRKTYSETNGLLKAVQGKIAVLESALGPLQDQVAILPEKCEMLRKTGEEQQQAVELFNVQKSHLEQLEVTVLEHDRKEQAITDLNVEIDKLEERIANGREKIARQDSLIGDSEKAQQVVVETQAGKDAYESAAKRLTDLRSQERRQRLLEQEKVALEKDLTALTERYSAELRAIESADKEISDEQSALEQKRQELTVDEEAQQLVSRLPEIRTALNKSRALAGRLEGRRAGLEEGSDKLGEGICPFLQESCKNIAGQPPKDIFADRFTSLDLERKQLEAELLRQQREEIDALAAQDRVRRIDVQVKGIEEQIEQLTDKRKKNTQRRRLLEDLKADQQEKKRHIDQKLNELKQFSELQLSINRVEEELKQYQGARDLYVANHEHGAKLPRLQAELKKYTDFLNQLLVELKDKQEKRSVIEQHYNADQHNLWRREKDRLRQAVGALGQKVEGLNEDVSRLNGEIAKLRQLEKEIAAKRGQIKGYAKKETLVKFLRNRVFRNVSSSLSQRFREEISQRANRIYRIIAEVDEELDWGDNYQIILRDMHEGKLRERVDDQLSGGQIMSAVVALRLAMLQTIGARIAFFDEPTSNLDAARRENLAHAFRAIDVGKEEVTEHWYDQLFLISHDVAFTEVTDQILTLDHSLT